MRESRDSLREEISQSLNENLAEHEVVTETVIYTIDCVEPAHARQTESETFVCSRLLAAFDKNSEKWAYVLQADLYNKLSQSKVIQEAALRSGSGSVTPTVNAPNFSGAT